MRIIRQRLWGGPGAIAIAICLVTGSICQSADFHFTLIGNSMLELGIDFGSLSSTINRELDVKLAGGARCLWKFCTLWYACKAKGPPKYALMEFRATELTDPMDRNTYGREAIGSDPDLLAAIATVESDPPPQVSGNHDFYAAVERSYLPYMIRVARSNGVDLILARHKAPSYRIDETSPHDAWWNTVMKYRQDLAAFCQSNGVYFLDYQFAPQIRFAEHYIAAGDDHLNYAGKTIWTRLLAADLNAILGGRRGTNECTSFPRVPGDWEWRFGLGARDGLDDAGDSDNDGISNYAEYLADTNPTDSKSVLAISSVLFQGGKATLTWHGGTAAAQYLEAASALSGRPEPWTILHVFAPPTPTSNVFTEETDGVMPRFYRLRAELSAP